MAASGGSGAGTGTSNTQSSATPVPAAITPSVVVKGNVCKVQSVRLNSKHGKYSVSFKLSCSTAKSASVTIKAFKANGKLIHTYRLTIATNKAQSVKLSGKVHRVTVVA